MKGIAKSKWLEPALGAALVVLCGVLFLSVPIVGDPLIHASYDHLFRFGEHAPTNRVTLILMDNDAYGYFHQTRGVRWDRGIHAQLLNRLADDGCSMVVMDSFFRAQDANSPEKDVALANAMRRQKAMVLIAEQSRVEHPGFIAAEPQLPDSLFLSAAGGHWGVAWLDPDDPPNGVVRRHWPFPSPQAYPSLPRTAAILAGARVNNEPEEQWVRYYGSDGAWTRMSYRYAISQRPGFFRDQIVFIGTDPKSSTPSGEDDQFQTPYTSWTHEACGGVEILVTEFLNLMNHDWLRRPPEWLELAGVVLIGIVLGMAFTRLRVATSIPVALLLFVGISAGAIAFSYFTNYWFPWLIVSGVQVPCACGWTLALALRRNLQTKTIIIPQSEAVIIPETTGYRLFQPPFGRGAYGRVWLAQNNRGEWRALKAVYQANFGENTDPYEREFNGINKYKPVSDKHPSLLPVEFVSKKLDGYFYYVMELGDALEPGWEKQPTSYRPLDLMAMRKEKKQLSARECIRIGIALADAVDFLHRQGLTHRDIKPQNIIFVNGQPKLADMGLITEAREIGDTATYVGTPGFMPPPAEPPGTPQADIYALGMVLYVVATGHSPAQFPGIATAVAVDETMEFLPLNTVILKACKANPRDRYPSAGAMRDALKDLEKRFP